MFFFLFLFEGKKKKENHQLTFGHLRVDDGRGRGERVGRRVELAERLELDDLFFLFFVSVLLVLRVREEKKKKKSQLFLAAAVVSPPMQKKNDVVFLFSLVSFPPSFSLLLTFCAASRDSKSL